MYDSYVCAREMKEKMVSLCCVALFFFLLVFILSSHKKRRLLAVFIIVVCLPMIAANQFDLVFFLLSAHESQSPASLYALEFFGRRKYMRVSSFYRKSFCNPIPANKIT